MAKPLDIGHHACPDLSVAQAFLEARNFLAAERMAKEALALDPENARAMVLRVEVESRRPDHARALGLVRSFLATHPTSKELRILEMTTLLHLRRKREVQAALKNFRRDFPDARFDQFQIETIYCTVFGTVGDVRALIEKAPFALPAGVQASLFEGAGAYLEAVPHFREALAESPQNFGLNWSFAYNQLMLCRFGEARRYARNALRLKPRRFEKRVIACSYLFCIPTVFYAHLLFVCWRMAIGQFPTKAATGIFLLFAPALYYPLVFLAHGWTWLGLPFGGGIALGSALVHALAMLSFEPRIASLLASKGKPLKLRNF